MRTFPLLALSLLALSTPTASASWASLHFDAGDQSCLVPTSIYESCLHSGLSAFIRADGCDTTNVCHFTFDAVAAASSQDPVPRTVTLTRDNVTACENYGIDTWVSCHVMAQFDRTIPAGKCDNTEFHISAAYGVPPATQHLGGYGGSPYQRPEYATIILCRNATTGDLDDIHLVRDHTLRA